MPALRFVKYQAIGNDFVVVDGPLMTAARAVRLCDRKRGIGADGILTVTRPRSPGAAASMHIYNADGSIARMCGNGIRCVARHLADAGNLSGELTIDTDAGPRTCAIHRNAAGQVDAISVEMGPARLGEQERFTVGEEQLLAHRVNLGNPHAVLFDEPTRERAGQIGPAIERQVPGGVNVGFAKPVPGGLELVVWERGCGLTEACGTGACAAAVASVHAGSSPAGTPLEVRLPGGALTITVSADLTRVTMRGPAELVYQGETALP